MNYTQLSSAIQTYTQNDFPDIPLADGSTFTSADQINRFIEQAEQRIYNSVQVPSVRRNVTGVTTSGNKYLSCPDDFLAPYSLAVYTDSGPFIYLLNKDVNFIREVYPTTTDTGTPKYYALFGPAVAS